MMSANEIMTAVGFKWINRDRQEPTKEGQLSEQIYDATCSISNSHDGIKGGLFKRRKC